MSLALAGMISFPVAAQDFGSSLLLGIGNSAMENGKKMLESAPEKLEDFLKSSEQGQEFASNSACLGSLQVAINAGTVLANILSFSSVETFEDSRGPVGRFRMLINGEKLHVEAYCRESVMTASPLPWGSGNKVPRPVSQPTLDAAAGLFLLLHSQGAFNKELPPMAVEGPSAKDMNTSTAEASVVQLSVSPLSAGEKNALSALLTPCWNVGSLSSEALRSTVVVKIQINQDGTPITESIKLDSSSGGSQEAARQAFEVARRAILRCGGKGFDLPIEKYSSWEELTFVFSFDDVSIRVR